MTRRAGILADEKILCGRREKLSEPAKVLLSAVQDMDVEGFSDRELDDLERAAATVMAAVRREHLGREGFVQKKWARSTAKARAPRPSGPLFDEFFYKLENVREGEEVFVAEAYRLDAEQLDQIAQLERRGWDVSVETMGALQFPGRTLSVIITRRERKKGRRR